jgi:hypothetical protein
VIAINAAADRARMESLKATSKTAFYFQSSFKILSTKEVLPSINLHVRGRSIACDVPERDTGLVNDIARRWRSSLDQ